MLKWYADIFKLTESSITPRSLRRLMVLLTFSLPAMPMILFDQLFGVPDFIPEWLWLTVLLISVIALFAFAFTRFVNRFYARDKYLDEWEVRIKHQSMAFAFQAILYIIFGIMGVGVVVGKFVDIKAVSLDVYQLSLIGFIFALAGMYIQTYHALFVVNPIDKDDDLIET